MDREKILQEITEIFREVFDDDELEIFENTSAEDIEEWDSLENINLMLSIEKLYGIKFTIQDMSSMNNVGDMITMINEKR